MSVTPLQFKHFVLFKYLFEHFFAIFSVIIYVNCCLYKKTTKIYIKQNQHRHLFTSAFVSALQTKLLPQGTNPKRKNLIWKTKVSRLQRFLHKQNTTTARQDKYNCIFTCVSWKCFRVFHTTKFVIFSDFNSKRYWTRKKAIIC